MGTHNAPSFQKLADIYTVSCDHCYE